MSKNKIIIIEGTRQPTTIRTKEPVNTQMYISCLKGEQTQFTIGTLSIQLNKEQLTKLINELNQLL